MLALISPFITRAISYLLCLSLISCALNPLFIIIIVPFFVLILIGLKINYFILVPFIITIILVKFIKTSYLQALALFLIHFALGLALYFSLGLSFFISTSILFTIIYTILFISKTSFKDDVIYQAVAFGLAIGFIAISPNRLLPSLIISSLITSYYSYTAAILLLLVSIKDINLSYGLILVIPLLSFIKSKLSFFISYILIGIYLFSLSYLNLISLIFPLFYLFYPPKINVKQNDISYTDYLKSFKKGPDSVALAMLDDRIKDVIKSYCATCPKIQSCFKQGRIRHYQYLMSLLTTKMKINFDIGYFNNNCDFYDTINALDKLEFEQYSQDIRIEEAISFQKRDEFIEKIISFFKKSSYQLAQIENVSRNSLRYRFVLKNDFVSIPLLNYRLNHLLNKSLTIKKDGSDYYLSEKPLFKISFDSIVLAKGNIYIAGDNILIKQYENDIYFALADGMGSGLSAYEASKALLNKLEKLIELGLEDDKIIQSLKHIYEFNGYNDIYSTLDFFHISRTSFDAKLFKIASSNTYIIKRERILVYKTDTLPLSMPGDITSLRIYLDINDLVIITSDGVAEALEERILLSCMRQLRDESPSKAVYRLSRFIYEKSNQRLNDDISIIAIKILPKL